MYTANVLVAILLINIECFSLILIKNKKTDAAHAKFGSDLMLSKNIVLITFRCLNVGMFVIVKERYLKKTKQIYIDNPNKIK